MGALIKHLNAADAVVELARQGLIAPIIVIDRLVEIGFYDVRRAAPGFVATWEGVEYRFHFTEMVERLEHV